MRYAWVTTLMVSIAPAVSGCGFFGTGADKTPWPDDSCQVPSCDASDVNSQDPWAFTASACLSSEDWWATGSADAGDELAELDSGDCTALVDQVKEVLLYTAKLNLRRNLDRALSANCEPCRDPYDPGGGCQDAGVIDDPDPDPSAGDYSTTNTQVPGIDEADFVKNDGGYVYMLSPGKLTIIDAWPAAEAHVVAEAAIEGTAKRLYVHEDLAIVYSAVGSPLYPADDCTYGYNCEFTGDGYPMKMTIFDISDRSQPLLTREIVANGAYLNSRRIGDIVHTVLVSPMVDIPYLSYWPSGVSYYAPTCGDADARRSGDEIAALFAELWQENRTRIANLELDDIMPTIRDRRWQAGAAASVETQYSICDQTYLSRTHDGVDLITLASFDPTTAGALDLTTVFGKSGAVYASADALYLAQPHDYSAQDSWYYDESTTQATTVHKFRLTAGSPDSEYVGSGVVKGRLLNQFAMDEKDDYLRMATTSGYVWGVNTHSTVMTLREDQGHLEVAGMVDNIAPSEDIRAVRFNGDVGYVVTFKKTDPLFVIDLVDPTAPQLRGELHIPGFSTYMHMLDAEHILSIGYDADDQGSFAWFQGIALQIMVAADLDAPALLHKEVIGTRGSTSDAATDHLAFNYYAPRSLLAIPMVICEGDGSGGDYGDRVTFDGLLVYRVTVDGGFSLVGGLPHAEPYAVDSWAGCDNWWTSSSSPVQRSIFMEDWVYSISRDLIQIAPLDELATPAVSISL